VASLTVGIILRAMDGNRLGCDEAYPSGKCPQFRETGAASWTLIGVGVGAILTSAYLIFHRPPTAGLEREENKGETSPKLSGISGLSFAPAGVRLPWPESF